MTTLHLLHGFIGAGKTTFAKRLAGEISAMRFTPDELMVKLYGHNPPEAEFTNYLERVTELIWQMTEQLIQLDRDVILDFGFWSRASRDEARSKALELNVKTKLYLITVPESIMKKRVQLRSHELPEGALMIDVHAFESFKHRFEPLGYDEPHVVISTDV